MKSFKRLSLGLFPVLLVLIALFTVTDDNFLKISEVKAEYTIVDPVRSLIGVTSSDNLTLNPISLVYSSYFGGSDHESWCNVATDVNGATTTTTSNSSPGFGAIIVISAVFLMSLNLYCKRRKNRT